MATKDTKTTLHHDFQAANDAELDVQMRAFKAAWTSEHGDGLAIDGKRSLGPGKVRVTFRVVPAPGTRGSKKH
jgi:hypothetical protein